MLSSVQWDPEQLQGTKRMAGAKSLPSLGTSEHFLGAQAALGEPAIIPGGVFTLVL